MKKYLVLLFILLAIPSSFASDVETRARALGQNLRCMVCEGQSIEDSNAGLAKDMKSYVRQRITAGDSDDQIIADLVSRYGDSISLKPPVKAATAPLWFLPPIILVTGIIVFVLQSRRRRRR